MKINYNNSYAVQCCNMWLYFGNDTKDTNDVYCVMCS